MCDPPAQWTEDEPEAESLGWADSPPVQPTAELPVATSLARAVEPPSQCRRRRALDVDDPAAGVRAAAPGDRG